METQADHKSRNEVDIRDQSFAFRIKGGDRDGQLLNCDLTLLGLVIKEVQDKHKSAITMSEAEARQAQEDRGLDYSEGSIYFRRTAKFIKDLSDAIADNFGFCTPTIADDVWTRFTEIELALKKNTESPPNSDSGTAST